MTTTGVRLARAEDVPTLAEVLALAFDSDPVTRWHVPEDARRVPLMTRFFAFALESIFLPLGAVWTSEERSGAAVWMPHQAHDAPPTPPDPSGSSIDEIFGEGIKKTVFRSEVYFVTLFSFLYDLGWGLGAPLDATKARAINASRLRKCLANASERFQSQEVPAEVLDAVLRASADLGRRRTRLDYLCSLCH